MNRNKRTMPKRDAKKAEKEIKKGQKALENPEDPPRTDSLTPKKALSKLPAKRQKVEKPLMDATVKGMAHKKKMQTAKHSKRTTPGDVVGRNSNPQNASHVESKKTLNSAEKKNLHKKDLLKKKLDHRKPNR